MKLRGGLYGLVLLIGAAALAGCGGGAPSVPAATSPAYPLGTPMAEPETAYPLGTPTLEPLPEAYPYPMASEAPPAAEGQPGEAALIELAKKDLAQQLSVVADQITVVSSAYMDWPDSSLGCPKGGMAYAQVITPGYRIVLAQAQKQYDYHTDLTDRLVLCTP